MKQRTALYHVFGDADRLLYIGISYDFGGRWKQHARKQPWWDEHRRMTVYWYDSRPEAARAEIAAIKAERPKYNKKHAVTDSPRPYRKRTSKPKPKPKFRHVEGPDGIGWTIPGSSKLAFNAKSAELHAAASWSQGSDGIGYGDSRTIPNALDGT